VILPKTGDIPCVGVKVSDTPNPTALVRRGMGFGRSIFCGGFLVVSAAVEALV
jgi:hypothetical protein